MQVETNLVCLLHTGRNVTKYATKRRCTQFEIMSSVSFITVTPYDVMNNLLYIYIYDALCEVIYHALLTDNKHAKREQRCSGYDNSRSGDIFHPDFVLSRPGFFDVTVANSLQPSFIIKAASNEERPQKLRKLAKTFIMLT